MIDPHDTMTHSENTATNRPRIRRLPLIAGGVLWVLVVIGLWVMWRSRPTESPVTVHTTKPKPANSATAAKQSDEHAEESPWDPAGIEDFALTERSGRTITKADLLGHPWVVCFVFTRCAGPCPKVSGQMRKLQDATEGTDVRLVTISVDPDFDTPERLRKYADVFGADRDHWLFLTGDKTEIYYLIEHSFKMPVMEMTGPDRQPGYEVLHSTNILHVDSRGRVLGKYNALSDSDMAALRRVLLDRHRES